MNDAFTRGDARSDNSNDNISADSTGADNMYQDLPPVLAGPILRHVSSQQMVLWLVATTPLCLRLKLYAQDCGKTLLDRVLSDEVQCVQVGTHAHIHLINVALDTALPQGVRIQYDLGICSQNPTAEQWINDWAPHLCLPGAEGPDFVLKTRLDRVFHGSCRRPHHTSTDGLVRADRELEDSGGDSSQRPALLLMTGDQIYADDVAGPMLRAIHGLIERLGLFDETLHGSVVDNSQALRSHPNTYYRRQDLLPAGKANEAVIERILGGVRKPVFTTANAKNHLISLNEVIAMYLLVWSPVCWTLTEITQPTLSADEADRFNWEKKCIEAFVTTLSKAARVMAHCPCYMIFDDHDITDDWNLSAEWEATAYGHPFSGAVSCPGLDLPA